MGKIKVDFKIERLGDLFVVVKTSRCIAEYVNQEYVFSNISGLLHAVVVNSNSIIYILFI